MSSTTVSPLATPQRALLHAHIVDPADATYHLGYSVHVRASLTSDDVRGISRTLVGRHPQLHATFDWDDGVATQTVNTALDVHFESIEFAEATDDERRERIMADHARPFDLARGPPARFARYGLADGTCILATTIHHIVLDGWAGQILVDDLLHLVDEILSARSGAPLPPPRPAPSARYETFVDDEQRYLQSDRAARARAHWTSALEGRAHPISLPASRPSRMGPRTSGVVRRILVDDAHACIGETARRTSSTPFAVVLAAWSATLGRVANADGVVVAVPMLNRSGHAMKSVVGHFVNLAPVPVALGEMSFVDVVHDVQRQLRDALRHQAYPLSRVIDDVGASRAEFPNVHFGWADVQRHHRRRSQNDSGTDRNIVETSDHQIVQLGAHADLAVTVYPRPDATEVEFRCDAARFDIDVVAQLADGFVHVLTEVARDVTTSVANLQVFDDEDALPILRQKCRAADKAQSAFFDSLGVTPRANVSSFAQPSSTERVEIVSPRTPAELAVFEMVRSVGRLSTVSVHENLLARGLDSLALTQVMARVSATFGQDVSLMALFAAPTIEGIAALVSGSSKMSEQPIVARARGKDAPLSSGQERMWFQHQLEPDGVAYSMPAAVRIRGLVDIERFRAAFEQVVARHDSLRTVFPLVDGAPVQRVDGGAPPDFVVDDLRTLDHDVAAARAAEIANGEAGGLFDIERGPLLRVRVIRITDDDVIGVMNMHHIISDQWSYGVLFHDLTEFYRAMTMGEAPALVPLSIQFADAAAWQAKQSSSGQMDSDLAWWTTKLAGMPDLDLPTDKPRPPTRSSRGLLAQVSLDDELVAGVRALAAAHQCTPFMVLLAAYVAVLARLGRASDFGIGVPIAGRGRMALEPLIGPFVNTFVIRAAHDKDFSFVELLKRTRSSCLDAFAHQDAPFDRVVRALAPRRDPSRTPVVQVMFNLANTPLRDKFPEDLSWDVFDLGVVGAQFDLSLAVDLEITQRAGLIASADLFHADTVERILRHWRSMLACVVRDPASAVDDHQLLSSEERAFVIDTVNATACEFGAPMSATADSDVGAASDDASQGVSQGSSPTIFDAIHDRIASQPTRTAVTSAGVSLTYGALGARVDELAHALSSAGVRRGDVVGVMMRRTTDLVASLLATWRVGAAYLPLDVAYPPDRVTYALDDAKALVLLIDASAEHLRETFGGHIIDASTVGATTSSSSSFSFSSSSSSSSRVATEDDIAYVIYTSGSTGKPKGVSVSHRALHNFVNSMIVEPGISRDDVLLAVTSVSFDIHGLELYCPLAAGAELVLATEDEVIDGVLLRQILDDGRVSVMQATPATWRLLLLAGWAGTAHLKILCGGEAFPTELVGPLTSRAAEVWNMYGPTETTIWSSIHRVKPDDNPVPIGTPIANTQFYVLDDARSPTGIGVPGELFIGGRGLADGYVFRDDLTVERFVKNPFVADPSARMYRTGDLARVRKDGVFECLGRVDQQVKLFGFRIEPGEVEVAMSTMNDIAQVSVVVRTNSRGHPHLAAFVVTRAPNVDGAMASAALSNLDDDAQPHEAPVSVSSVRAHLSLSLPDYMIPSVIHVVDVMPLTPNGKIDRRALSTMDVIDAEASPRRRQVPRNETEERVFALWEKSLGHSDFDVETNFFEAGGQSLSGAEMMIAIANAFAIHLPLRLLFQHPTVTALAREVMMRQTSTTEASPAPLRMLFPVQPNGRRRPLFLVAGAHQRGLLFGTYEEDFMRYLAAVIPALGQDQPIYAFRPLGLFRDEDAHRSVEEMAAAYIQEMRTVQPEGPYVIGGECVGGFVAYEMAQQLRNAGDVVQTLLLLDTPRPSWRRTFIEMFWFFAMKVRYDLGQASGRRAGRGGTSSLTHLFFDVVRGVRFAWRHGGLGRLTRGNDLYYFLTLMRYRAKPLSGSVKLVVNAHDHGAVPLLGWSEDLLPGLEARVVPGTHVTRLSEHGDVTGRVIRDVIDDAAHAPS